MLEDNGLRRYRFQQPGYSAIQYDSVMYKESFVCADHQPFTSVYNFKYGRWDAMPPGTRAPNPPCVPNIVQLTHAFERRVFGLNDVPSDTGEENPRSLQDNDGDESDTRPASSIDGMDHFGWVEEEDDDVDVDFEGSSFQGQVDEKGDAGDNGSEEESHNTLRRNDEDYGQYQQQQDEEGDDEEWDEEGDDEWVDQEDVFPQEIEESATSGSDYGEVQENIRRKDAHERERGRSPPYLNTDEEDALDDAQFEQEADFDADELTETKTKKSKGKGRGVDLKARRREKERKKREKRAVRKGKGKAKAKGVEEEEEELVDGETSKTSNKRGRYTADELALVADFGRRVARESEELAKKLNRSVVDVRRRAGLSVGNSRLTKNIANMYRSWYAWKHSGLRGKSVLLQDISILSSNF